MFFKANLITIVILLLLSVFAISSLAAIIPEDAILPFALNETISGPSYFLRETPPISNVQGYFLAEFKGQYFPNNVNSSYIHVFGEVQGGDRTVCLTTVRAYMRNRTTPAVEVEKIKTSDEVGSRVVSAGVTMNFSDIVNLYKPLGEIEGGTEGKTNSADSWYYDVTQVFSKVDREWQ